MNQIQKKNPQVAQEIKQAQSSGTNPRALLQQMMGISNNQQIQQVFNQARNMGVPDEIIRQIQNNR